jgi:hypothetical protein
MTKEVLLCSVVTLGGALTAGYVRYLRDMTLVQRKDYATEAMVIEREMGRL